MEQHGWDWYLVALLQLLGYIQILALAPGAHGDALAWLASGTYSLLACGSRARQLLPWFGMDMTIVRQLFADRTRQVAQKASLQGVSELANQLCALQVGSKRT